MPYLFLPQNTDLSNLSDDDILIILEARPRMCIFENEDGLMELKPHNGREVNVSENIYEFYVRMAKESNEVLLSEASISRSGQISSSEGGIGGYNCMAHAISEATGIPFSTVDSTLASEFSYYQGNGILVSDFYKATSLFNGPKGGDIIEKQGLKKLEGTNLDGKGVLVVRDVNLNYHAVNAFQIFNGGIWTKEYGNSGVRDFIYTNDQIVTMYQYY